MLDIPSITGIVASIGVIVGVVLAYSEIRNLVKTRQTDLNVRLSPWLSMSAKELQETWIKVWNLKFTDYNDFEKKYGTLFSGKPAPMAVTMLGNYGETLGNLLYRKLMDIDLIGNLYGGMVLMTWEKMKPLVEGIRKQYNDPRTYKWFEYLYNEMKKREQRLQQTQQ